MCLSIVVPSVGYLGLVFKRKQPVIACVRSASVPLFRNVSWMHLFTCLSLCAPWCACRGAGPKIKVPRVEIGDKVLCIVPKQPALVAGIVRFRGKVPFGAGIWYGIELEEPVRTNEIGGCVVACSCVRGNGGGALHLRLSLPLPSVRWNPVASPFLPSLPPMQPTHTHIPTYSHTVVAQVGLNNGTVSDKWYFLSLPKCGIFLKRGKFAKADDADNVIDLEDAFAAEVGHCTRVNCGLPLRGSEHCVWLGVGGGRGWR